MALETELKIRVSDHRQVRKALESAGALFVKRELEVNTFLDTPDSVLLKQGRGLRVRSAEDLHTHKSTILITHKGPRRPGPMKIREETELRADSYADAVQLLAVLGYEVKLSFQKRRETWELGECEVVLDELPILGLFAEIEGPDEASVNAVRDQLGLSGALVEPEGYAVLVAGYLSGSGKAELTFSDWPEGAGQTGL